MRLPRSNTSRRNASDTSSVLARERRALDMEFCVQSQCRSSSPTPRFRHPQVLKPVILFGRGEPCPYVTVAARFLTSCMYEILRGGTFCISELGCWISTVGSGLPDNDSVHNLLAQIGEAQPSRLKSAFDLCESFATFALLREGIAFVINRDT